MPKVEIDYTQTTIYKICCNDTSITDIYVGSTTNFANRKYGHKTSCNTSTTPNHNLNVYKFIRTNGGWNNWSMLQIENIKCKDKREALIREKYWIEILKPKLNINNPYTSVEEKVVQKHDWYEDNKDYILEKAKNNYEENKEQKIKYQTQYAQENKEKISEYHKEYQELNKEKLKQQKKIYREEHKEESRIVFGILFFVLYSLRNYFLPFLEYNLYYFHTNRFFERPFLQHLYMDYLCLI